MKSNSPISFFNLSFVLQGVIFIFSINMIFCGEMPSDTGQTEKYGTLEIRTRIVERNLQKASVIQKTVAESLVVQVVLPNGSPIRYTRELDLTEPFFSDTIQSIPSGTNYPVKIWTVDKSGDTIHIDSVTDRTISIPNGKTTLVRALLIPASGSLYFQIGNIPTTVDSVIATFTTSDRTWRTGVKRKPKLFLHIDNIPHKSDGDLKVFGIDTEGDTLYTAITPIMFNALTQQSVQLHFTRTKLILDIGLQAPGITVCSGTMESPEHTITEQGGLLITEIMYAANDSEYIEIYNVADTVVSFDTFFIEIDGRYRLFTDIQIPAHDYLVFGREKLPWVDITHSTQSALDLTTTGNWITLRGKDSTIIDRVIHPGENDDLEWPTFSGKCAIELNRAVYNVEKNNYGSNWHAATEVISFTEQRGTPGKE